MQRFKLLLFIPLLAVPAIWLIQSLRYLALGNDFYSPYLGAQRILAGLSPYGTDATAELVALWGDGYARAGIAYPLPLLLLVIPFALLAFPVAASLWTAIGFPISLPCVFLSRQTSILRSQPDWYQGCSLVLPFVFWPLFNAIRIGQASLIWFGLAIILVLAILKHKPWIVALCVVLLVLKPQAGLVFAAYGAWWLLRNHRRWLLLVTAAGALLLGASLIIQPQWIPEWLAQVRIYNAYVKPPFPLPVTIIVLVVAWRMPMPWWAKIAIVQAVLFPISGIYSFLPILLAWCAITPPLALLGAATSWLWVLIGLPVTAGVMILFVIVPLLVAVLWEGRPKARKLIPASLAA